MADTYRHTSPEADAQKMFCARGINRAAPGSIIRTDGSVDVGAAYRSAYPHVIHDAETGTTTRLPHHTDPTSPVTNPKEGAGAKKPATWSVMPRWVLLLVGRVMTIGAAKYDPFNYREAPITSSTYEDAMERHSALWFDGEDNDPETGVSHLASVIASCSLLLDAQATGMLVDNRQKTGLVRKQLDALEGLMVSHPLPPKNRNAPSLNRKH